MTTDTTLRPLVELVSAPPVEHQIADYLTSLLGPARPRRVAQMLDPGGDKYRDLPKPKDLTWLMLEGHAAGSLTYAASLEYGRIGAADIDRDTPAAGKAELMARYRDIRAAGLQAIAIYVENELGKHYGGHIFGFYAELCNPDAIAAQWRGILPTVAEIWPCGQVIRLPFGYHRWAETRGEMWYISDAGELLTFDLDTDLTEAFTLVEQLPTNSAPPKAQPVDNVNTLQTSDKVHYAKSDRPIIRQSLGEAAAGRASLDDVKARFNAEHTIESVLDRWGKASETRDGWACDCGVGHTHETTLYISKRGRLFSYSPRCHLYTKYGWDAFGLEVFLFHNNNITAALKELNPIRPRKAHQEAAQQVTEYRTSQQDADAERRRAARRADATATRDTVAARAQADDRLTPCDRATLQAMLDWAAEHHASACWAGRTTIAQRAGYSLGSVKRSTMLLKEYGYYTSEGSGGAFYHTARRTFTCGSLFADETIVNAKDDPRIDPVACEGGAAPALEKIAPPAQQEAANDEFTPATDDTPLDMDEIDRWVSEIQTAQNDLEAHRKAPFVPHFVLAVNASERHEPQSYWDKHEAQTWIEAHPVAPLPVAAVNQQEAKNEASKARKRAKWDEMTPSQLGRELGVLRNYLKSHSSAIWPRWQISELNDRIAALTPVSEAVDSPPSQAPARRPAPTAPALVQPDLFADAPPQNPYYIAALGLADRLRTLQQVQL